MKKLGGAGTLGRCGGGGGGGGADDIARLEREYYRTRDKRKLLDAAIAVSDAYLYFTRRHDSPKPIRDAMRLLNLALGRYW